MNTSLPSPQNGKFACKPLSPYIGYEEVCVSRIGIAMATGIHRNEKLAAGNPSARVRERLEELTKEQEAPKDKTAAKLTKPDSKARRIIRNTLQGDGRMFVAEVDNRTMLARKWRNTFASIVEDLGGIERTSTLEQQLMRRCATLSVVAEKLESDWLATSNFDADLYVLISNTLQKIAAKLGLKRIPKDITPSSLDEYIKASGLDVDPIQEEEQEDDEGADTKAQ